MKKGNFKYLLSFCLIISAMFAMTACGGKDPEDPHTHNYSSTTYTIEADKAYKVKTCDCNEFVKEEIVDAVIANPNNIETLLNQTNNATIVLSEGEYSPKSLWFKYANTPTNNLNIVGVDGVEIEEIYASNHDTGKITNLYIANIKFTGLGVHSNDTDLEGVIIENCEFVGTAGVGFGNNGVKDVTIKDCTFNLSNEASETQTAIYFNFSVENFSVENCTFNNIPYNAIQANTDVKGKITIKNNQFIKTGSRVVYLNGITNVEDVELEIENNSFCSPTEPKSDGNFVKVGTEIEISKNNSWDIESGKPDNYYFAGACFAD